MTTAAPGSQSVRDQAGLVRNTTRGISVTHAQPHKLMQYRTMLSSVVIYNKPTQHGPMLAPRPRMLHDFSCNTMSYKQQLTACHN